MNFHYDVSVLVTWFYKMLKKIVSTMFTFHAPQNSLIFELDVSIFANCTYADILFGKTKGPLGQATTTFKSSSLTI